MKASFRNITSTWQKVITFSKSYIKPWQKRWIQFAVRRPILSRGIKWTAYMMVGFFLTILLFVTIISFTVPTSREFRRMQTQAVSEIYAADNVLIGQYYNQYRMLVPYDSIPIDIIYALVATEDERFFDHRGIDYRSWGRVLYRSILRGDRSGGGGSTLSQQLAKSLLTRKDYHILPIVINKTREIIAARRLEKAYTKRRLLALYLNTVPFSDNMFGIDVAAQRFFSKPVEQLKLEEGAVLIGSLQGTSLFHPVRNPDRAKTRRNVVFQQMEKNHFITKAESDSLKALPMELEYNREIRNAGIAPYFREYVRQEAERILADIKKPNGEPYNLHTDGLLVYSTLHSGLQRQAEESVKRHLSAVQNRFEQHWRGFTPPWHDVSTIESAMKNSLLYQHLKSQELTEEEIVEIFNEKDSLTIFTWDGPEEVVMSPIEVIKYHIGLFQVGFISIEPQTGFIRTWVGGADFDFFQYDHVRAKRQSGSVFKPIVYTQALICGIDPCEQIANRLLVYHEYAKHDWAIKDFRRYDPEPNFKADGTDLDDWIPQNADGKYGGSYSMQGALTNSINVATIDLIMRTGVDSVIQLARKMGITSDIPKEPSIALGAASMSLYDLTQAFTIFANQGRKVEPVSISHIATSDGEILVDFRTQVAVQVIDPEIATIMTKMLESVANSGTASRLRWRYGLYNYPIAAKTGTSQNHADGWFIGYTPKLVSGVWVGGDSPLVRFRNFEEGQGASTALPIWALFMKEVLNDPDFEPWQGGAFPALTAEQRQKLACPMRIKSREEILADSLAQDSLNLLLLDTLPLNLLQNLPY